MTDKRTEHMTFRLPIDLKMAIEAIASARDISPSSFVCDAVSAAVERERRLFMSLSPVFGKGNGVPGAPDENACDA